MDEVIDQPALHEHLAVQQNRTSCPPPSPPLPRRFAALPPKPPRKRKAASVSETLSSEPSTSATSATPSLASAWQASPTEDRRPLGLRQKLVVDYLRGQAHAQTPARILAATTCDVERDELLVRVLTANEKVGWDAEGRLFYRAEIDVKSKAALLERIRRAEPPVSAGDVADAYPGVAGDLDELCAEGLVLRLACADPEVGADVLFPVDLRLRGAAVDADVVALWHAVEIPEADDLVAEQLLKIGLVPAPRAAVARREKRERVKKPRKASKLRSVTNVHLMHLLEGEAPTTIE